MKIRQIRAEPDWTLYVCAEDGREGRMQVAPYLADEAFAPLRNPDEFFKVRNGSYFVEWDCGADLSADTIEARWSLVENLEAQV